MLNSDSRPAKPAAIAGDGRLLAGVERGEAQFRLADQRAAENLLQHRRGHADHADAGRDVEDSTAQISQNCGVLSASSRWTLPCVIIVLAVVGGRPAFGPPAVRRHAVAEGAAHHEDEIDRAQHHEGLPDADRVGVLKWFISRSASGEPIIAPPPKPMMAMPVAMPRRSGNHLIRVETGEI